MWKDYLAYRRDRLLQRPVLSSLLLTLHCFGIMASIAMCLIILTLAPLDGFDIAVMAICLAFVAVLLVGPFLRFRGRRMREEKEAEEARKIREAAEHAGRALGEEPASTVVSRVFETYNPAERDALEEYIDDAFGPICRTFYDASGAEMRVDIAVSEPDEERDYYTLTTIGMGANRMAVPPELAEKNRTFAELTMLLPPDWDLMNDVWPFHVLRETARRPFEESNFIELGDAYRGAMMEGSGFHGVLVARAVVREDSSIRVLLPSGRLVSLFMLLPIYRDEWNYIMERQSSVPLWRRYLTQGKGFLVDPGRTSCVGDSWLQEDLQPFEWNESRDGKTWFLT